MRIRIVTWHIVRRGHDVWEGTVEQMKSTRHADLCAVLDAAADLTGVADVKGVGKRRPNYLNSDIQVIYVFEEE